MPPIVSVVDSVDELSSDDDDADDDDVGVDVNSAIDVDFDGVVAVVVVGLVTAGVDVDRVFCVVVAGDTVVAAKDPGVVVVDVDPRVIAAEKLVVTFTKLVTVVVVPSVVPTVDGAVVPLHCVLQVHLAGTVRQSRQFISSPPARCSSLQQRTGQNAGLEIAMDSATHQTEKEFVPRPAGNEPVSRLFAIDLRRARASQLRTKKLLSIVTHSTSSKVSVPTELGTVPVKRFDCRFLRETMNPHRVNHTIANLTSGPNAVVFQYAKECCPPACFHRVVCKEPVCM